MLILPLIFATSSLIYLGLAIFVLVRNRTSGLNRLAAAILMGFCVWSFHDVFRFTPAVPEEVVRVFVNLGAFGWCSFASVGLWFALEYTGAEYPKWLVVPLLVLLPLLFVIKQWTGDLVTGFYLQPFGWADVWSNSIWPDLYDVYCFAEPALTIYMVVRFARTRANVIQRHQAAAFSISGIISLVIGFVLNRALPRLGIYSVPQAASIAGLIWAAGLTLAVVRYRMLTITPATAAENILATMSDLLMLLDPEGNILTANESTLSVLGYQRPELVGRSRGYWVNRTGRRAGFRRFWAGRASRVPRWGSCASRARRCRCCYPAPR